MPAERWEPYLRRDPRNAAVLRETTRWGTFLDDLGGFDAEFFGVSPREAELMDPQQRLALEVSWEALEHAGVPPRSLAGSDTAVLMGVNSDDYGGSRSHSADVVLVSVSGCHVPPITPRTWGRSARRIRVTSPT